MPQFDGIISLLDSRSFGSIWFWLVLIGMWSAAGRAVLGVPAEVLARARRDHDLHPEGAAAITLLDWLSLSLSRWHLSQAEGAAFLGVTAFALTSLAILGFGYGLEMAQALVLLLLPFWLLFWMRVRLARHLLPLLHEGQAGARPVAEVAAEAIRRMVIHRRLVSALSIVSVAVAALWGAIWALLHPYGF